MLFKLVPARCLESRRSAASGRCRGWHNPCLGIRVQWWRRGITEVVNVCSNGLIFVRVRRASAVDAVNLNRDSLRRPGAFRVETSDRARSPCLDPWPQTKHWICERLHLPPRFHPEFPSPACHCSALHCQCQCQWSTSQTFRSPDTRRQRSQLLGRLGVLSAFSHAIGDSAAAKLSRGSSANHGLSRRSKLWLAWGLIPTFGSRRSIPSFFCHGPHHDAAPDVHCCSGQLLGAPTTFGESKKPITFHAMPLSARFKSSAITCIAVQVLTLNHRYLRWQ